MEHPIGHLMQTTLENIKDMVDVNTVIGEPIPTSSGTVIPVSKVSFGFVAGGGDYDTARQPVNADPSFAGGSGAGVSVQPVGFLVVNEEGVKVLPAQYVTPFDRVVNAAPQLIEDIQALINKKDAGEKGAFQ